MECFEFALVPNTGDTPFYDSNEDCWQANLGKGGADENLQSVSRSALQLAIGKRHTSLRYDGENLFVEIQVNAFGVCTCGVS